MKNGYQLEIGWVDRVGKMKRIELRNNSISMGAGTFTPGLFTLGLFTPIFLLYGSITLWVFYPMEF